ncbi:MULTISPECIES: TIGR02281 family clan AA aspartic protease [Rhodomicrobium]|uniref:retropepsin-like aspartic protease family protein n=1 Tax=Rhodomicrobium TaxID=1068 RepID=UPI000B4AC08F|nr:MULTISPECIES: TIGR02281 family clan AA aspartic protease [Rhodomicrobium]
MAFRGGMRRAANEAGLWLLFAAAAIVSFTYFEDVYRVLEQNWPKLHASVAPEWKTGIEPGGTTQSVASREPETTASAPQNIPELRASVTELDTLIDRTTRTGRKVTLTANLYGHYIVQAEINRAKVELLTDTGATYVALNYETAVQLGFRESNLRFTSRSSTANGIARVAPVNLDYVRIGSIVLHDVKAVVAEPGKMTQNLLGMSFINRLSGFELSGGRLNMVQHTAP